MQWHKTSGGGRPQPPNVLLFGTGAYDRPLELIRSQMEACMDNVVKLRMLVNVRGVADPEEKSI
jgi:hypothetical protein